MFYIFKVFSVWRAYRHRQPAEPCCGTLDVVRLCCLGAALGCRSVWPWKWGCCNIFPGFFSL